MLALRERTIVSTPTDKCVGRLETRTPRDYNHSNSSGTRIVVVLFYVTVCTCHFCCTVYTCVDFREVLARCIVFWVANPLDLTNTASVTPVPPIDFDRSGDCAVACPLSIILFKTKLYTWGTNLY